MDFNNIRGEGFWSDVSKDLNENFNRIGSEIDKLVYKTEKSKGLFQYESQLREKYPHPDNGDWALVGSTFPVKIYYAIDGIWVITESTWDGGGIILADYLKAEKITNLTELL